LEVDVVLKKFGWDDFIWDNIAFNFMTSIENNLESSSRTVILHFRPKVKRAEVSFCVIFI
jgi:hypothetical protein